MPDADRAIRFDPIRTGIEAVPSEDNHAFGTTLMFREQTGTRRFNSLNRQQTSSPTVFRIAREVAQGGAGFTCWILNKSIVET
ncbi:MAG: hypothetical protein ABI520_04870 [Caldimonas sp.]